MLYLQFNGMTSHFCSKNRIYALARKYVWPKTYFR